MSTGVSMVALLLIVLAGGAVLIGLVGLVIWLILRRNARPAQGFPVQRPSPRQA